MLTLRHIGHGTLYFYERVLHGDISRSNILLSPETPSTTGLLIDLDHSSALNPPPIQHGSSTARRRTGTIPYMAIDLLRNEYEEHLYHHDVESFLYVILWSCLYNSRDCGYVPGPEDPDLNRRVEAAGSLFHKKVKSITADYLFDPLFKWREGGTYEQIGGAKKDDMEHGFESLLGMLKPGFDIEPLRVMLRALKKALFGDHEEYIVRPSMRLQKGWSTEQREIDEWALYETVRGLMDKTIEDLVKGLLEAQGPPGS